MSSFTDPHVFPNLYYFFIDQNYTLTYLLYGGGEKLKVDGVCHIQANLLCYISLNKVSNTVLEHHEGE